MCIISTTDAGASTCGDEFMLVVPSIGETRVARRAYIVHAIGAGTCLRLNPKPRRLLLHPHPNDGRLAPGPPTSSVVIAAGPVDGRHLVRGVEYFFKQHATFHEVFKTICVVTSSGQLPEDK